MNTNSTGPPEKKIAPRFGQDGAQQRLDGTEDRTRRCPPQVKTLVSWFAEAERIAHEYQHTGNAAHLRAFCRHVSTALAQVERSLP